MKKYREYCLCMGCFVRYIDCGTIDGNTNGVHQNEQTISERESLLVIL